MPLIKILKKLLIYIILATLVLHCSKGGNKPVIGKPGAAKTCLDDNNKKVLEGSTGTKDGIQQTCIGGSWDGNEPPATCLDDSGQAVSSGMTGTKDGVVQTCSDGTWVDNSNASSCQDDLSQTVSSGMTGTKDGVVQTCSDGTWLNNRNTSSCQDDLNQAVLSGMTGTKNGLLQKCSNGIWSRLTNSGLSCTDDFGGSIQNGRNGTKGGIAQTCNNGLWQRIAGSTNNILNIPPVVPVNPIVPNTTGSSCQSVTVGACRNACNTGNPLAIADANRDLGCRIPGGASISSAPIIPGIPSAPVGSAHCNSISKVACRNACNTGNPQAIADANRDLGCSIP